MTMRREGAIGGYGALGSYIEAAPRSKYPSLGEVWEERIGPEGTDEERDKRLEQEIYDTQGLYGDKINEEGLMKLMKGDPLADSYGLTNNMDLVKSFAEDPRRPEEMGAKAQSLMDDYDTFGYTYPGEDDQSIYIRDLNKFTNQPDINNPNTMGNIYETNKQIADVVGHERRHRLIDEPRLANIKERYEAALPNTLSKHKKEEIFNRIMDLKSGQLRGRLEGDKWGTTEMKGDYRDMDFLDYALKNTENIPMMGTGLNAMQKLDPIANEFIQRGQTNYLPYDEQTGYNRSDLQKLGIGAFSPHGFEYGNQWQQPDQQEDSSALGKIKNYFNPGNIASGVRRFAVNKALGFSGLAGLVNPLGWASALTSQMPYRGATSGAGGYTSAQLNRMNALGGYYSEPAREQRRNASRVENMLARKEAGKSYSQANLNQLTMGSRPGHYDIPGGNSGGGGGAQPGSMPTGTAGQNPWGRARGGLAGLWQRY